MIVVDSSVWIDLLRDRDTHAVRKLKLLSPLDDILVGDIILLEVLQGARDEDHARRMEINLRRFNVVSMLDDSLAVQAARNYRRLRAAGITIRKTVDMMIATFCMEGGHGLLHADRDFDAMTAHLNLRIV